MSSFTESALESKLADLNSTTQSIQTLSLWLIHHRKHCKIIVNVWYKTLKKAKGPAKLTLMYLANDVIQNSKKKGPEYMAEFAAILKKAFENVFSDSSCDEKITNGVNRLLNVWAERGVYDAATLDLFKGTNKKGSKSKLTSDGKHKGKKSDSDSGKSSKRKKEEKSRGSPISPKRESKAKEVEAAPEKKRKHSEQHIATPVKSPPRNPPEPEVLIRIIQELENSASGDAGVREQIAKLPPEVSDTSLLERIQDKNDYYRLAGQVNDALSLLADYNGRLAQELDDRKTLAQMLNDFVQSQKDQLSEAEQKLEEYKIKLQKVNQVRNELKSHIQNLPDLTLLPDVTGGLKALPSAADLFN